MIMTVFKEELKHERLAHPHRIRQILKIQSQQHLSEVVGPPR